MSISDAEVIKTSIDEDIRSKEKKMMYEGIRYYTVDNDINERKITYMLDGVTKVDHTKSNIRIAHAFHKLLVMQKVNYIVGKPITFNIEDENYEKLIYDVLGYEFDDTINAWATGASNKGKEWLHHYIDEDGELKNIVVPAEQVIPFYEPNNPKKLQYLIRYYTMQAVHLRDANGKPKEIYKVEFWDSEKVTYYIQNENDEYVLCDESIEPINPRYHWYEYNTVNPSIQIPHSWGRVPFTKLSNNNEELSDLVPIKSMIDDYDLNASDSSNNLAEIQEMIHVLKGYEGEDFREFMTNLKTFKAIVVNEGGDVDALRSDIPTEARNTHLQRLKENIYAFGMGVDPTTDRFGNSPSGVALKFLYQNLELKANEMIRKMTIAVKDVLWYVTKYINMKHGTNYNHNDVGIVFNTSMLINETEIVENLDKSKDMLSQKTILAKHPYVEVVAEEIDELAKESGTVGEDE